MSRLPWANAAAPSRRSHVDHFHGRHIDAEVFHLLEEAVMGGGSDRHADLLAFEFLGAVLVDFELGLDHAVVIVVVDHGDIGHLKILSGGRRNDEGRHALADRDLDVTRGHRRRHSGSGIERLPVDLHAKCLVVQALDLGVLERHRHSRK
jgi:hypothetical protein